MKPFNLRLSTRITISALLLVTAGAVGLMFLEEARLRDARVSERRADLETAMETERLRLQQAINTLRQDTLFLSTTPPTSGIIRAIQNNGFDTRYNTTTASWKERLEQIFSAFTIAHPEYFQLRFIGVADGARELVRVDQRNGKVSITPPGRLQAKSDRYYVKEGMKLRGGEVYLSEIDLNEDFGVIERPYLPVLRAVTPVFTPAGELFGLMVLNLDATRLLESVTIGVPPQVRAYVSNMDGNYLHHPNRERSFGFLLGREDKVTAEFPGLAAMFDARSVGHLPLQAFVSDGRTQYLAADKVYFDPHAPARFLLLSYYLPARLVAQGITVIPVEDIVGGFLVMLLIGGIVFIVLQRMFAPLGQIVAAAERITAGEREVEMPKDGAGEIARLSSSIGAMMGKLMRREQEISRINAELEKRHFALFENMLDGYAYHRMLFEDGKARDYVYININDAFERLTGLRDVVGKKVSEVIPGIHESSPELLETYGRVALGGEPERFETYIEALRRWFTVTVYCPKPEHFVTLFDDITERKRIGKELEHKQELFNEAERLGKLGSWELDLVTGQLHWSDEIYRIFEVDPARFTPSYENFLNAIHPDDRDEVNRAYTRSLEDRVVYDIEHRLKMPDGRIKWVHEHCTSEFDGAGKPVRSVGAVQDITARRQAVRDLRVAAIAFETHDAIIITDVDATIIRVNRAFTEITGYSADEVIGKNPNFLSSGKQAPIFYENMWRGLLETGTWTGEMWDRRKSGEIYPKWLNISAVRDEAGHTTEYVGIFMDITERKKTEEEIRNLAFYDALTKLPNRRLLLDRFGLALSVSARSGHFGAVMFLDMDMFKTLNDTMGHDCGDLMLVEVARRIQSCVREVDTVARFGGDEFVVLVEEIGENEDEVSQRVASIAEKIRVALAEPYRIKEREHHSSPSIGVCLYRGNRESVDDLLKHADMAMYQVKDAGRNAVRFFDPDMQHRVEAHAALETDLHKAVSGGQLRLYYQVQVDNDQRPIGAEALVRWLHPEQGLIPPARFIPVAEESSLILDIGHWVLDTACRQLAAWSGQERTSGLSLAVNVSAQQFHLHDFVEQVAAVMRQYRFEPSLLKLELTEGVVLKDVDAVVAKMHALRALGIKLSMDDFGTGYSSLSYLKKLPLDQIKIDQSFVRDITNDPNDAVMVQTIIDLAQNFRLNVIAEGVETMAQLTFLKHHGCMAHQGYLFSRPVPVEEFEKLVSGEQGVGSR